MISLTDNAKFLISKIKLKKYFLKSDIDSLIDATKQFVGHGFYERISMSQKRKEIKSLAEKVKSLNPAVIVEIGTRKGGTLFIWCRYTSASKIVSIDLPGGIHGGGYPPQKQKLYKSFLSDQPQRKLFLLQNDSHSENTFNQLVKILNGDLIDFLFIDGDHTYSGVKKDFEMYSKLVRKGGLVAFHDIVPNKTTHEDAETIEVPQFWNEIREHYDHEELIESTGQLNMGIGVLKV